MTSEEQFKAWYSTTSIPSDHVESAREAYLAATKTTAARCVEICKEREGIEANNYQRTVDGLNNAIKAAKDCAAAITKEVLK